MNARHWMREGMVTYQELQARWLTLPMDWQTIIIREAGLKPEHCKLVHMWDMRAYQITRNDREDAVANLRRRVASLDFYLDAEGLGAGASSRQRR